MSCNGHDKSGNGWCTFYVLFIFYLEREVLDFAQSSSLNFLKVEAFVYGRCWVF